MILCSLLQVRNINCYTISQWFMC